KRRDERFSQRGHHLTGYFVCFVLVPGDLAAVEKHIVAPLHQRAERLRASKRDLSMTGEEVEEPLLFRHQGTEPAQHERLARNPCKNDQLRTISRLNGENRGALEPSRLQHKPPSAGRWRG